MKKNISFLLLFLLSFLVYGQNLKGKIVVDQLYSSVLENDGGEDPTRRITVYLPPDYDETTHKYPVIYFLHGFIVSDSLQIAWFNFDKILDKAINSKKIKPVIVVMPNHFTLYRGSWYTNSSFTGNWADFTGKDLVTYVDKNFRTIPNKESRGIAGHSMGGQGAIRIGMLFPDVFSSVYALSPATLGITKEIGIKGKAYKRIQEIKTREELITGLDEFYPNLVIAMGRAYTPNPNKPPFYADLPFNYIGDSLIVNEDVLDIWKTKSVLGMVDDYTDNLKMLKALKIDWGRNEEHNHIPLTSKMLSQKLENLGVNHYAEEYIGTHGNKVYADDGRVLNDMLPFFNTYLKFK